MTERKHMMRINPTDREAIKDAKEHLDVSSMGMAARLACESIVNEQSGVQL